MKKSEYRRRVIEACHGEDPLGAALRVAVAMAEEVGVQWDPEEPELPERVGVEEGKHFPSLIDPDAKMALGLAGPAVVREAAARYNAVGRFPELVEWRSRLALDCSCEEIIHDDFKEILAEERKRLTP